MISSPWFFDELKAVGHCKVFLDFFSKNFLAERELFLVNALLCPTTFKISKSPGEQFLKMPLCAQPRPKSTKSRWNKSATSPLCTQPHLESTNPHDKHCARPDYPTKKRLTAVFYNAPSSDPANHRQTLEFHRHLPGLIIDRNHRVSLLQSRLPGFGHTARIEQQNVILLIQRRHMGVSAHPAPAYGCGRRSPHPPRSSPRLPADWPVCRKRHSGAHGSGIPCVPPCQM